MCPPCVKDFQFSIAVRITTYTFSSPFLIHVFTSHPKNHTKNLHLSSRKFRQRSCPCRKAPSIATTEFSVVRGSLGIRGNSRRILGIDIESCAWLKGRYRV
jgi:hypothetical protein